LFDLQVAFPEHDGRCDLEGCDQPARLVKLAGCEPMLWSETAPAASLAVYCGRDHAGLAPTAVREDAEAVFGDVLGVLRRGPTVDAWQALLDAYPEPVALAGVS
jgi:hypothetical protein